MIKKILCSRDDLAQAVARQNELIFAKFVGINITNGVMFEFVFELDETSKTDVHQYCANCGANNWRYAISPDTLEICNVCGNSR